MTVKIKSNGKVSVLVSKSLKPYFKNFLELLLNDRDKKRLDITTAKDLAYTALITEVYTRYFVHLHMVDHESRLTLTLAQAYALWELAQDYEHFAFADPQMGQLLMELHQRLS